MAQPSSALRTVSAKRTTASRTTADRVSPIPAATSSSSNSISSSLNLVGTGVITQSSIQFVERSLAALPWITLKVAAVLPGPRPPGQSPALVATTLSERDKSVVGTGRAAPRLRRDGWHE